MRVRNRLFWLCLVGVVAVGGIALAACEAPRETEPIEVTPFEDTSIVPDGREETSNPGVESCATACTTGGVMRIIAADTDPNQIVHGLATEQNSHHGEYNDESHFQIGWGRFLEIAHGPLVIANITDHGNSYFYIATGTCDLPREMGTPVGRISRYEAIGYLTYQPHTILGPISIRTGDVLCSSYPASHNPSIAWAGFRPYN